MHPSEILLPKPCDGITFWGEISSYRGLMDFYRFFLKFFRIFLPTGFWGFFFQILDVCGEMLAEKNWAFQSSRLKKKAENCKSHQEGQNLPRACSMGCSPRRVKESCPLPIGFKSSTEQSVRKSALWLLVKMGWKQIPALATLI